MKTGRVSDFLNYKNASDVGDEFPFYPDEEISSEFAEDFINNYDSDFPETQVYENDNQDGRYSDS